MSVENILRHNAIPFHEVTVGEIHLCQPPGEKERKKLAESLEEIGLELIDNRMSGTIEKMKHLIIAKARNEVPEAERPWKLSHYLTKQLHQEYTHLSKLFSNVEGRTIENFFIEQRIEKAKELIVYGQLTLSEIAYELDYSSVAHLSNQFKKVTGLTPSHFKSIGAARRKTLDNV